MFDPRDDETPRKGWFPRCCSPSPSLCSCAERGRDASTAHLVSHPVASAPAVFRVTRVTHTQQRRRRAPRRSVARRGEQRAGACRDDDSWASTHVAPSEGTADVDAGKTPTTHLDSMRSLRCWEETMPTTSPMTTHASRNTPSNPGTNIFFNRKHAHRPALPPRDNDVSVSLNTRGSNDVHQSGTRVSDRCSPDTRRSFETQP